MVVHCPLQRVEAWDKNYQYLLFAAEPYETIGFKVGKGKRGLKIHNREHSRVLLLAFLFRVDNVVEFSIFLMFSFLPCVVLCCAVLPGPQLRD